MARRQKARPQCLRPYPRGVRGEAQGADRGDESRTGRAEAAKSGGDIASSGAGKESEGNEKVKKEQVKRISRQGCQVIGTLVGEAIVRIDFYSVKRKNLIHYWI